MTQQEILEYICDYPQSKLMWDFLNNPDRERWCISCACFIESNDAMYVHLRDPNHWDNVHGQYDMMSDVIASLEDKRFCGECPNCISTDINCICRIGHIGYYMSHWQRTLWGYVHDETGQIDAIYPQERREDDLSWDVMAIRNHECIKRHGGGD